MGASYPSCDNICIHIHIHIYIYIYICIHFRLIKPRKDDAILRISALVLRGSFCSSSNASSSAAVLRGLGWGLAGGALGSGVGRF